MLVGGAGFAIWSLYSYLRIDNLETVASAQMSSILFGAVGAVSFLIFLIKLVIKKYVKSNDSVYSNMFELSTVLNKNLEKIKFLGVSLFKKNPIIISGASLAAVYILFNLLKSTAMKKKQDLSISKKS